MSSSGPRSGFLLLTFASVHGLRLALAAWKSGAPEAATWNVSCSCFASSSLRALAQPYLNCSRLSVTARFQDRGQAAPVAGKQPQPVNEADGRAPRRVRRADLPRLASRESRHAGEPTPSSAEWSWDRSARPQSSLCHRTRTSPASPKARGTPKGDLSLKRGPVQREARVRAEPASTSSSDRRA